MRRCYMCNRLEVAVGRALCADCKQEIVKDLTTSEYVLPLLIVGAMSLVAVFVA